MEKWIKINDDVEYSTDIDFFGENQLCVVCTKSGTRFISRLDGSVFASTKKRNITPKVTQKIIKNIHTKICELRYGGQVV